jgi:hypothetical protein
MSARGVPKPARLSPLGSAVQSFREIHNITAGNGLPAVVLQDIDEILKGVDRGMRRRFFPRRIEVTRGVDRALHGSFRNTQSAAEPFEVVGFKCLGVGETVFIMQPNPKGGLRNADSAGELAHGNSPAFARGVDQFLKRGMRRAKMNQSAARRDRPARFPLGN